MNCPHCHQNVPTGTVVCPHCHHKISYGGNTEFFGKVSMDTLSFQDIFTDVFKHHSIKEGETLFLAGTLETTPKESEMLSQWKKPWLFARVFLIGLLLTVAFYWLSKSTSTAIAGYYFVAASFVPITVLIFFWEMNIPRNIPLYYIIMVFFCGGALSLVVTMLLNNVIPQPESMGASFAALVEEPAKIIAIAVFLRNPQKKYILNGILIGAAVGAGFAAFESAGYIFNFSASYSDLVHMAIVRGYGNIGGHALYAAIAGGALAMVKKNESLSLQHFMSIDFWKFAVISIVIHYINNSNFYLMSIGPIELGRVLLEIACWVAVFILMKYGMNQILDISNKYKLITSAMTTYHLVGLNGYYKGKRILVEMGNITFGRDPQSCNLLFPSNVKGVSRRHCTLTFDGMNLTLCDHHSTFGTYIGPTRLQPDVPMKIRSHQKFCLGNESQMFEIV